MPAMTMKRRPLSRAGVTFRVRPSSTTLAAASGRRGIDNSRDSTLAVPIGNSASATPGLRPLITSLVVPSPPAATTTSP